jgi:ribosomal protein S18 acetylase RimI-like enzyme
VTTDADVLTALRRSDRALAEQVAEWESLEFGVAYTSTRFAALAEANQLRDVWLVDAEPEAVFARTEAYYRERGLVCHAWSAASGQDIAPVERLLLGKGWRKIESHAMALVSWGALDVPPDPSIRILPARAMPKAYRATFDEAGETAEVEADAARLRLDDSNMDAFVAMADGRPAGRISYLSVGDAARLADLYVSAALRRRGIGRALATHILQLARRLLPRVIVASLESEDVAGQACLARCGFAGVGSCVEFRRAI